MGYFSDAFCSAKRIAANSSSARNLTAVQIFRSYHSVPEKVSSFRFGRCKCARFFPNMQFQMSSSLRSKYFFLSDTFANQPSHETLERQRVNSSCDWEILKKNSMRIVAELTSLNKPPYEPFTNYFLFPISQNSDSILSSNIHPFEFPIFQWILWLDGETINDQMAKSY